MKFGKSLSGSIHSPWRDYYINYSNLKRLLREKKAGEDKGESWTDEDESRFAEELLNVELEKVTNFQNQKSLEIKSRILECESKLESLNLASSGKAEESASGSRQSDDERSNLKAIIPELDLISNEVSQLERYSRLNFSGFRKIVKKHDKRRGAGYKLRPLLAARLASLPLNTDDYSPLLFRLSAMYSFIRRHLRDEEVDIIPQISIQDEDDEYNSVTFFVHPDDLLEVKTSILRHLPVLVYNPLPSKDINKARDDPGLTSVYFDTAEFSLYKQRLERRPGASSLRLRWSGSLKEKTEVTLERKTVAEEISSRDQKLQLKKKYIASFLKGTYHLENKIAKLKDKGAGFENEAEQLQSKANEIQNFILLNELKPLIRASYNRTAFQVPGDDTVRVSIDTNLHFEKEDFDPSDNIEGFKASLQPPASNNDSMSRFPWSVLTIKTHCSRNGKNLSWVRELTSSHLLREAPKFSKFVHGVASLFEDQVTEFPLWMSLLDTDIRRDPESAFHEEKSREEQFLEETQAVGSYGGTPRRKNSLHPHSIRNSNYDLSSHGSNKLSYSLSPQFSRIPKESTAAPRVEFRDSGLGSRDTPRWFPSFRNMFSETPLSKYGRSRRQDTVLPPGIEEPKTWIKDSGPLRIEPKVWLANQRTFIKWQQISVLLASLSLSLYNGAGQYNTLARGLGIFYTMIALSIAAWGWIMYNFRGRIIRARSGADLDNVFGPLVVCASLAAALCFNIGFRLSI